MLPLISCNPCNQRQMIVDVSLFDANGKPSANPAKLCWLGIGIGGRLPCPQKISSNLPEIGNIASDCKRLYFGITQHHVHSLRDEILDLGQNVRIETELEYSVGPSGSREFRFCHFV